MNRLKEIKELKALAEELQLENREIIRKYKITELAGIYNGIGPDSFPEWLRGLVSALHPSLAVVAFIHDIEWHESDGSKEKFTESNNRFKTNGYTVAKANYSWWNPLRYIVMNHARRFGCSAGMPGAPPASVPCAKRKEVKCENGALHSRNRRGGRSSNDRRMFPEHRLSGILRAE